MEMLEQGLNPAQRQAVCHHNGPLLVLAGPGSGKTRVITHRIAHIIYSDVAPDRILALTFTNKAATEMAHRLEKLVPHGRGLWISTFHSFCARILRRECTYLGYTPQFSIYDVDDQKRAFKYVVESLKLSQAVDLDTVRNAISHHKNHCVTPAQILKNTDEKKPEHIWQRTVAKVYAAYQEFLLKNNAMDFDDLLLKTLDLFTHYKEVTDRYQEKFLYILVDEFQDTNLPQYKIAQLLAQKYRNICATGDPDQSIYSWRGANIGNILEFEKDFPDAVVIKLEQNYRSTKTILHAASELIANNKLRKQKALWTDNPLGEPIRLVEANDDTEQAQWVCRDILRLRKIGVLLRDIVIFYRTNAQSRTLETELRGMKLPYTIVGGIEFYQRAEVKDVLAYLKLLVNENDDVSLRRILNSPPRAIGKTTEEELVESAKVAGLRIWQALQNEELLAKFSARARKALTQFTAMIMRLRQAQQQNGPLLALVENMLTETGYLEHVRKQDQHKDEEREENIKEFLASISEYEKQFGGGTLVQFLERVALIADVDKWEQGATQEGEVTMMTLHSAKGLEFPVVYIVGLMEGLLPHSRSLESAQTLEEERRLMFVGITRAQQSLTLSYSLFSYRHDGSDNTPSRFLEELPPDAYRRVKLAEKPPRPFFPRSKYGY